MAICCCPLPASAQSIPGDDYLLGLKFFEDGQYREAAELFQSAARRGIKTTDWRWVDSTCFATMLGECHYHLGDLGAALQSYNTALTFALDNRDWMQRLDFGRPIEPLVHPRQPLPTWGRSARGSRPGNFPEEVMTLQGGGLDNERSIRYGGVITATKLFMVRANEIARCTAIALQRRAEILGPVGAVENFSADILQGLSAQTLPPNAWPQVWINVHVGLAKVALGDDEQALRDLENALTVSGQWDHPLTGIALLEMARIAMRQQQFEIGADYYMEASLAAAHFGQTDIVEQAFREGIAAQSLAGRPVDATVIGLAAEWAKALRATRLYAMLMMNAAEGYAEANNWAQVRELLAQVPIVSRRTDLMRSDLGARHQFLSARMAFREGNSAAGMAGLNSVMAFQRKGSPWLFQIAAVDRWSAARRNSAHIAMNLYEQTLSRPQAKDWVLDPAQSLALRMAPMQPSMEHWFQLAWNRRDTGAAIRIAELTRHRRYVEKLPLGGRSHALRWLLAGGPDTLGDAPLKLRHELLQRFPEWAPWEGRIEQLQTAGRTDPKQLDLEGIQQIAKQQEAFIAQLSLGRVATNFQWPMATLPENVRGSLKPNHALLSYFRSRGRLFAYAMQAKGRNVPAWEVTGAKRLRSEVGQLLQSLGLVDAQRKIDASKMGEDSWQEKAQALRNRLLSDEARKALEDCQHWTIVPDDVVWYVPWHLLTSDKPDEEQTLLETELTALPLIHFMEIDRRAAPLERSTLVVWSAARARISEAEWHQTKIDHFRQVITGSDFLKSPLSPADQWRTADAQRLVVMDETSAERAAWTPLQLASADSAASHWLALPPRRVEQLVLPNMHTAAESGLKKPASDGSELFFTACHLLAAGARTILISRWATQGDSAVELTREFVQELDQQDAANAWRRSVQLLAKADLDLNHEPRIQTSPAQTETTLTTRHPYFWAGYLLMDRPRVPDDAP